MSLSSRMYPETKILRSRWIAQVLKFVNESRAEAYSIHPANQVVSGPRMADTIRAHVTVANINAGVEFLPAIAGYAYRMIECIAVAVGGAAGTVTTVDVLGTQSTSGVKLVALAQANLTQSTVLRSGATGAAVLADAASYDPCDANTAITIGKTGGSIVTATHVDFIFSYVLEAA